MIGQGDKLMTCGTAAGLPPVFVLPGAKVEFYIFKLLKLKHLEEEECFMTCEIIFSLNVGAHNKVLLEHSYAHSTAQLSSYN